MRLQRGPPRPSARRVFRVRHSEMIANRLIGMGANFRDFSERTLIRHANYLDFDSAPPLLRSSLQRVLRPGLAAALPGLRAVSAPLKSRRRSLSTRCANMQSCEAIVLSTLLYFETVGTRRTRTGKKRLSEEEPYIRDGSSRHWEVDRHRGCREHQLAKEETLQRK